MRKMVRIVGWLNSCEGSIHIIVSLIGLWGLIATGVWDIRLMTPIIENFIFGVFSIATGQLMAHIKLCPHKGDCINDAIPIYPPVAKSSASAG